MALSTNEVIQIALLARLALEPDEGEAMARDLGSILDHMRELESVDVSRIEPMGGVSDHSAPMRKDEPGPDELQRPIEAFAPDWQESFFVVPRLAALDADALEQGEAS